MQRLGWTLPRPLADTMFDRAHRFRIENGGRFDPRPHSILLWSEPSRSPPARLIASIHLRRGWPTRESATLDHVAWNPDQGGTVAEVCRALELLGGIWADSAAE